MNETISAALRDHADGDIHIERLLGAVHAGARRRRQRRVAVVGAALAVVVVLASVSAATPVPRSTPVGGPAPIRPPLVAGTSAADSPTVLGADPTLFHLDLVGLTHWRALAWSVRPGHEEIDVTLDDQQDVYVEVTHRADALVDRQGESRAVSVGGRSATAIITTGFDAVRWQPVPGLWAQAYGTADIQTEIDIAERLNLFHVYRCAVPFRLTLSGGQLNKCETTFSALTGTAGGGVWVVPVGSGSEYQVSVGDSDHSPVNEVVAGHAMAVDAPLSVNGRTLAEIKYPYYGRMAYFWVDYNAADAAVLRSIAAGFKPVLTGDPAGWPGPPFT